MRCASLALLGFLWLASCGSEAPDPVSDTSPETTEIERRVIEVPMQAPPQPQKVEAQSVQIAPLEKAVDDILRQAGEAAVPAPPNPARQSLDVPTARVKQLPAPELANMQTFPVAYETPTEAKLDQAFEVVLAIDATGDDSAVEGLPGKHHVIESEATLSETVEATLSGAAFDIRLTNKARQRLSPFRESTWRWAVTPTQEGSHTLYLEIHALVGEDESLLLDAFSDEISVKVNKKGFVFGISPEKIRTYVGIFGGTISAILGLAAIFSFLRRRKTEAKSANAESVGEDTGNDAGGGL